MTEDEIVGNLVQYRGRLWAMAFSICRDYHLTEDVLQDASLVLLQRRGDYDSSQASFVTWAVGVTRITALKTLQKRRPERLVVNSEVLAGIERHLAADNWAPDEDQRHTALVACMDSLQPEQARVMRLKYMDRRSVADIAADIGRTVTGTYSLLQRLRGNMLTCMRKKMDHAHVG